MCFTQVLHSVLQAERILNISDILSVPSDLSVTETNISIPKYFSSVVHKHLRNLHTSAMKPLVVRYAYVCVYM